MEIVQEDKGLDDYGFFVELEGDEIYKEDFTTNNQEKMNILMCYWKTKAQALSTFILL